MSGMKPSQFSPVKALQALYNQEASTDLTLDVNGHMFHGHRAVLVPACAYLERILRWFQPKSRCSKTKPKRLVRICLPPIQIAACFGGQNSDDETRLWFDRFLRTIYGLHQVDGKSAEELMIMAQIADYLVCQTMLQECDEALSRLTFSKDQVLDVTLFCQRYPLTKTLQAVEKVIAANIYELRLNPKLYQIEPKQFKQIMRLSSCRGYQQFFPLYRYVTGENSDPAISSRSAIKDPAMRKLFRSLLGELSPRWRSGCLNDIVGFFEEAMHSTLFNGVSEDQAFFSTTISLCYFRLSRGGTV